MQTFLLLTVAVLCALYAAYELAPEGWSAFVGALHGRAKAPASPVRDAPASQQGGIVDKPDARVPWPEHTPPARRLPRPVRRNVLLVTFGAIILLFAIDALFAAHTPVHLRLVSAGTHATLTVDGAAHSFTWPTPPTRVALLQNDPNSREWGIDGSQSLTASIANLDPAYLRSIAGAPYIAFDRWLRGEDGYDQWRNLHLNSLTNGTVTLPDTAQAVAGIPVGQSFTFDGDIYRLEQPVSVQLAFPTGAYTIRLDRANRALTIVDTPTTAGATTTIAQWYVPTDPWPYLAVNARTLAYAVAWAVLLLLLAVILGAALAAYSGERVSALWARGYSASSIVSLAALAIFLASALYVALGEYNGMPHIFDAQAYVFQAKVLASGRLFMPLPPLADSFPIPRSRHTPWSPVARTAAIRRRNTRTGGRDRPPPLRPLGRNGRDRLRRPLAILPVPGRRLLQPRPGGVLRHPRLLSARARTVGPPALAYLWRQRSPRYGLHVS